MRRNNLQGRRFGRLLVLKPTPPPENISNKSRHKFWLCSCKCGTTTTVRSDMLLNGNTTSCGCVRNEQLAKVNFIDETGNRYGRLLVLHRTDKPEGVTNQSAYWLCLCECGKQVVVMGVVLRHRKKRCCGCTR